LPDFEKYWETSRFYQLHGFGMLIAKTDGGGSDMNKVLGTVICLLALSFTAVPVSAQTRSRCTTNRSYSGRYYDGRTVNVNRVSSYRYDRRYAGQYWENRSRWDRSRDKITTAIGAGAGAVVGGLVGGKKGAFIGALAGGGGAALYTYKLRDRRRTF
jgi:hypothetical protein